MQRSGTSLARAIIWSHPDVAIFEWDLPLWTQIFVQFKGRKFTDAQALAELLDAIFSSDKVRECDPARSCGRRAADPHRQLGQLDDV
jgi:hypothetical protein